MLTGEEREAFGHMISRGKADARRLVHARVLLQADASEGGPDWGRYSPSCGLRQSLRQARLLYPPTRTVCSPIAILSGPPSASRTVSPCRQSGSPLTSTVCDPSIT